MSHADTTSIEHADLHSHVQGMVDRLAVALGEPVLLDNESLVPLAYSCQSGTIDEVRLHSVLQRSTHPDIRAKSISFGIGTATEAFRTPDLQNHGMLARYCVPVCSDRERFGYLWVVDRGHSLSGLQQALVREAGRELYALLDRNSTARGAREAVHQQLLARLLGRDSDEPFDQILPALQEQHIAQPDSMITVFAFRFGSSQDNDSANDVAAIRSRLAAADQSQSWFVCSGRPTAIVAISARRARADLAMTSEAVVRVLDTVYGQRPAIGWSGTRSPIIEAPQSLWNAESALGMAEAGVFSQPVTAWSDVGSWQTVATLTRSYTNNPSDLVALVDPAIRSLINQGRSELVRTLDVYLTHGCDARKTAAALHLHRSTLYYRLEKISELVGGELHDGDLRFRLMLGIRVAHLAGIYPT
jgi:DNA-binding PucR family transcriptional regulator